jgi:hypothetical protein
MFRPWRTTPSGASSHPARRQPRRFIPSLSGSASRLEDRVVLSAVGSVAHVAHPAVVHPGHTAKASSHHRVVGATTPVAVSVSTASASEPLATFSTTTTSSYSTKTVSPVQDVTDGLPAYYLGSSAVWVPLGTV